MEIKKLNCSECGKEVFSPNYNQRYCSECGKEHRIVYDRVYSKTNKSKKSRQVNRIKNAYKYEARIKACNKSNNAKNVLNLTFAYCKRNWNAKFRYHNCVPPEFTNEIWLREKIRMQALRRIKQLKLNLNENI